MQVTIEKLVYGGAGLARTDQGVVFVSRTAPGDVVEIDIVEKKKDYATGRVKQLLTPSPDRQEPSCPNYATAGCCHWQHIRYERQVDFKESILRESLRRLAKIEFVQPVQRITSPDRAYRLRATFHVHQGRMGFIREHSNVFVPIQQCDALAPELNAFIGTVNALRLTATGVDVVSSGSALAATFHFPTEPSSREVLLEIPDLSALTLVIGGRHLRVMRRSGTIEAKGFRYGLNSDAFFQANRFLLDAFIDEVVSQAGSPHDRVLDLFSGCGFFSIPLATVSRQLIGIDGNRAAVRQAAENAKLNAVANAEFAAGGVETLLASADVKPDLVMLNPPRTGAGVNVAAQVAGLGASRVIYVSCNPTTFAREAAVLMGRGYRLDRITMIDQFPNTYHIELVARFDIGT
jgi:23S rRNA (uracil1939-C5)-methyltransferase